MQGGCEIVYMTDKAGEKSCTHERGGHGAEEAEVQYLSGVIAVGI